MPKPNSTPIQDTEAKKIADSNADALNKKTEALKAKQANLISGEDLERERAAREVVEADNSKEKQAKIAAAWSHVHERTKRALEEGIAGYDRWESSMGQMMAMYMKLSYALNAQYEPDKKMLSFMLGVGSGICSAGVYMLGLSKDELDIVARELAALEDVEVLVRDLAELKVGVSGDALALSQPTKQLYKDALEAALKSEIAEMFPAARDEKLEELREMKAYDLLAKFGTKDEPQQALRDFNETLSRMPKPADGAADDEQKVTLSF